MIELPTGLVEPEFKDPRVMVIYSIPKSGKTTVAAQLPGNLILDLEGGTDLIAAPKVSLIGLKHDPYSTPETPEQKEERHKKRKYYLGEIIKQLIEGGNPYKYLTIDTATTLEDWCEYDGTCMYMESPMGKNWNRFDIDDQIKSGGRYIEGTLKPKSQWRSVITMGKGYGYQWLNKSYEKWINYIRPLTPTLIIHAHIKLKQIAKKDGKEVEVKDLDLTGQIKQLTAGLMADAIGYFHREGDKGYISFQTSEEVICGSRCAHLEGKDILISEKQEDGKVKTYWHNIFTELASK